MTGQRVTIGGDGPPLAGDLLTPHAGPPLAGVVICHPHPAYGGTRQSHVVQAIAGCAWIWNSSTPRGILMAPGWWPAANSAGSRTSSTGIWPRRA